MSKMLQHGKHAPGIQHEDQRSPVGLVKTEASRGKQRLAGTLPAVAATASHISITRGNCIVNRIIVTAGRSPIMWSAETRPNEPIQNRPAS
jgi:hypothetical protein